MSTKPRVKRPEIVLATWPNRIGAELFGDRRYPNGLQCDSMWLSLRVFDDDSFAAYQLRNTISDIGLYVWWSTSTDNISVEFKGHEIHSATVAELERIASELRRLNKRNPPRLHGMSYADHVLATLKAAGIKRIVEYRGIGVAEQYEPLTKIALALRKEIESRCPAKKEAA